MYETIYKISIENFDDEEIMRYFFTDYQEAKKDGKKMANVRKEKTGIDFFSQRISHFDEVTTIVHQFDDDISISVEQCGWAHDDDGKIRAIFGVDYTGRANYKLFDTEQEFYDYIKSTHPVWSENFREH